MKDKLCLLIDIDFLSAPPERLRSALDYEMLREIAVAFPELRKKSLEGFWNWAEWYLARPWSPPEPNVGRENPDRLISRAPSDALNCWSKDGLIVEKAAPYIETLSIAKEMVPMIVFASKQLYYCSTGEDPNEVQFVFHISLNTPRKHIQAAMLSWFKLFRKNYKSGKFGAPIKLAVLRFELAVFRLERVPGRKGDVVYIARKLEKYDKERSAKLSKGELRKIRVRMNRRLAEKRDEFLLRYAV